MLSGHVSARLLTLSLGQIQLSKPHAARFVSVGP